MSKWSESSEEERMREKYNRWKNYKADDLTSKEMNELMVMRKKYGEKEEEPSRKKPKPVTYKQTNKSKTEYKPKKSSGGLTKALGGLTSLGNWARSSVEYFDNRAMGYGMQQRKRRGKGRIQENDIFW